MSIPTRIAARLPLLASPSLPSSFSFRLRSFSSSFSHHRQSVSLSLSRAHKLSEKTSLSNLAISSSFSPGVRKLGNLTPTVHISRLKRCVAKKMAWSLEKSNAGVETHLGVVRPATEAHAEEAVGALRAGKVIAVPTDTLYGFACDACSLEAVNRIYEIKGRKHTSPLAVCVGDVPDIERFAAIEHLPHGLLEALLPGPVTLVLSRGESSILEKSLNPGLESIGVRVPDCNFIRDIARKLGSALALTSANISGQPSSVSIKDFENLWEHCAYVYNGGVLPSGRAGSTVVDLTRLDKYKILRPGSAKDETVAILERFSLEEEGTAT